MNALKPFIVRAIIVTAISIAALGAIKVARPLMTLMAVRYVVRYHTCFPPRYYRVEFGPGGSRVVEEMP